MFPPFRHKEAMTSVCPDCGSPLPRDAALMGLCPQCLLSMALEDSFEDEALEELPTLHGQILGERYQIRERVPIVSPSG